jgi:DNA-binding PadR family transcriptional regulator
MAETLEEIAPGHRFDLGNLYRLLRSLEKEGLVTSEWRDDLPGRAKRIYELTDEGRQVLDTWAESIRDTHEHLAAFLERYENAKGG